MTTWPSWDSAVTFSEDGPQVNCLHESEELKVVLVALSPGQALPPHPGPAASFHFLTGSGTMLVGEDEVPVEAGATVVVPSGAQRSVRAGERLAFLGNLGNPGAENSPVG